MESIGKGEGAEGAVLSDIQKPEGEPVLRPRITRPIVAKLVCEEFELSKDEFHKRTHRKRIAQPRQVYFYLLRKYTKLSLPQIASDFNMHHTTPMYGAERITELLPQPRYATLARHVAEIEKRLKAFLEGKVQDAAVPETGGTIAA